MASVGLQRARALQPGQPRQGLELGAGMVPPGVQGHLWEHPCTPAAAAAPGHPLPKARGAGVVLSSWHNFSARKVQPLDRSALVADNGGGGG